MTQYCPLCQKLSLFTGGYAPAPDPADRCKCGGVPALQARLAEAERLLREAVGLIGRYVDRDVYRGAHGQQVRKPIDIEGRIDAFLAGKGGA